MFFFEKGNVIFKFIFIAAAASEAEVLKKWFLAAGVGSSLSAVLAGLL